MGTIELMSDSENSIHYPNEEPDNFFYHYQELGFVNLKSLEKRIVNVSVGWKGVRGNRLGYKSYHFFYNKTHSYCITAIKNLLKKENYRDLLEEYTNKEISFEDFQKEIKSFPNKYTIDLGAPDSIEDYKIIAKVMEDVGSDIRDLSVSEVCEMFSVTQDFFNQFIEQR